MNKIIFRYKKDIFRLAFAFAMTVAAPKCHPDEGLWLPNKIPAAQLKSRMDFTVTPEWIEHWQKSSLGVSTLGSGSFVSPEGLILTNWHVALPYLQAISSSTNNYAQNGFIARTRQEEIPLPGLTLYSESWEDVKDGYSGEVDVIETARGMEYTLHKSKTFTDIRLVMAPEYGAAYFGGDIDNFEYPRFCLDMAFLRAYEDNMPVRSPAFFRFSKDGVREGELVFVTGWPSLTERRKSLKYLEFQRDHFLPDSIERGARVIEIYEDYYAKDGKGRSKDVVSRIFTLQNILKSSRRGLNSLNEASTLTRKQADEEKIKQAIARDPELRKKYGSLFAEIDRKMSDYAKDYRRYDYGREYGSALARNALLLVEKLARNKKKPDAGLSKSLANKLFLKPAFDIGLEERLLRSDLEEALRVLGPRDKYVKTALCGRDPEKTAHDLVSNSRYADAEFRKELLSGGWEAVLHSDDPLIKWALKIQALQRKSKEREARQTEELDKLSALYVKAVFDVNKLASGWDYVYSDEKGRSIALDARAIVESLRNIYNMDQLVRELLGE